MNTILHNILEEIRQETGIPAIAGIVVSHNSVIAQAAIGVRRLDHIMPITIHERFHAGSNTKAMTATLYASLVHKKLLTWQTSLHKLFPDIEDKILPEYESITLEMLLKHMAGIPPYMDDEAEDFVLPHWKGIAVDHQNTFFAKWLLRERRAINVPGTEYSYSNAGYSIVVAMAETVTGRLWKDILHEELFSPLGIDAVAGGGWPALHDPDQPWGHLIEDGKLVPHPPDDAYQLEPFLAPAGDVCISLPHFGRFLQMHLKGLQGKKTSIPFELIQRMHNHSKPGMNNLSRYQCQNHSQPN